MSAVTTPPDPRWQVPITCLLIKTDGSAYLNYTGVTGPAGNASFDPVYGTASNVQAFVDAYNKLKSAIDAMVDPGDPAHNQTAGHWNSSGADVL